MNSMLLKKRVLYAFIGFDDFLTSTNVGRASTYDHTVITRFVVTFYVPINVIPSLDAPASSVTETRAVLDNLEGRYPELLKKRVLLRYKSVRIARLVIVLV